MVALHALIGTSHRLQPASKEGSRAQTSFPTGTFAHNVAAAGGPACSGWVQQQKTFSLKRPPLCSLFSHHPQLALYINALESVNVVNICSNIPDWSLRKHIQFPIFKDQGVAESTAPCPFCALFRTNGIHCMVDRESCQRVRAIVGGRLLPRKVCFTRVVLLRRRREEGSCRGRKQEASVASRQGAICYFHSQVVQTG